MNVETLRRRYEGFWLDHEVAPVKLTLFRIAFFSLLAIDAWLQVAHAPRYGATDFNVPHITALGGLLGNPGRMAMLVLFLGLAYAAWRVVLGAASRLDVALVACLYSYGYFVSQLDNYQHHFLLCLVLLLTCFMPFDRERSSRSDWAVRLLLVLLSALYFWAAVAKMEPLWLEGRTLFTELRGDWIRSLVDSVFGAPSGPGDFGGWKIVGRLVLGTELFLAVALQVRRLRPLAVVVGPLFHLSIALTNFEIGLFSYYMFALYLLVIPDRWLLWLAERGRPVLAPALSLWERVRGAVARGPGRYITLAVAPLFLLALPFADAWRAAVFVLLLAVLAGLRRPPVALAHLVACAALVIVAWLHAQPARDYYRYWGGSSRRLGDTDQATRVYENAVARWPDYAAARVSLGNLYRRAGRNDDALREYRRAQALVILDDRPFLGEALIDQQTGKWREAAVAAEGARWRAFVSGKPRRFRQAEAILDLAEKRQR